MFKNHPCHGISWLAWLCAALLGCDGNARLVEQSQQSQQRQAEQNQTMARINGQVAEGARLLVEADAKARQDLIQVQQHLDQQRQDIHLEQQRLADQRYQDPIIADTILAVTMFLACLLPLMLGLHALRTNSQREPHDGLAELLIHELVADQPMLLNTPRLLAAGPDDEASAALEPPADAE